MRRTSLPTLKRFPAWRAGGVALPLVLAVLLVPPSAAHALPSGPLTVGQLAGQDGCLARSARDCERAPALDAGGLSGPSSVAASGDGRHVYVAAADGGSVVVLARDATTGALRQTSCVGRGRGCRRAPGIDSARGVAISPDGRGVYVASGHGSVAAFTRDAEAGTLAAAGCIGDPGRAAGCDDGVALAGAADVAVSPDGKNVYVAAEGSSAVVALVRDTDTNRLRHAGCVARATPGCEPVVALAGANSVSLSPDGARAFATADGAVVSFGRDASNGDLSAQSCFSSDGSDGCSVWTPLDGASSAVTSPDGRHLYVTAHIGNSLSTFAIDRGRLSPMRCVSDRASRRCRRAWALNGAARAVVEPDGRRVYVASSRFSHGIAVFAREPRGGGLRQLGCLTSNRAGGACAKGFGMAGAASAAVSPDGRDVYVLGARSDALAVLGPELGVVGRRWRVSRSGVVRLRAVCPANARSRCRGSMRLLTVRPVRIRGRVRQATLGAGRFSVAPGRRRTLRVRVARRFLPLVRRSRGVRVRPVAVVAR